MDREALRCKSSCGRRCKRGDKRDVLASIATVVHNRARLAYSAYVGFVQLAQIGQPRMRHDEFEAYIRDFIDILIPR